MELERLTETYWNQHGQGGAAITIHDERWMAIKS